MGLPRSAGILVPLFSMRSADDFGRGDFGGLAAFGALAAAIGHRLLLLLPLDETAPGEASPYSAMSAFALDPSYLSARDLSGVSADAVAAERQDLLTLNPENPDLVRLREIKEHFIAVAFTNFENTPTPEIQHAFDTFCARNADWLEDYALFRALKINFDGAPWEAWPAPIRDRDSAALAAAARDFATAIRRFQFGQFLLDGQWQDARGHLRERGVLVGGDLAFSPARDSAEVWAHQAWFDPARAVGAPPDAFSETGQRWDLPMPSWAAMRASGFALMRTRVRLARARYDFVRIDHVVGLFRTYGYPVKSVGPGEFDPPFEDAQCAQGEEILRLIIDSAGPMQIIAEDLGVIPPFVRDTLKRLDIPGYKVAFWETRPDGPDARLLSPAEYPELAVATTGTHDTETLGGWWFGLPETERRRIIDAFELHNQVESATLDNASRDQILAAIIASPARLTLIPIQDLFGWDDRINVPGAVAASNWRWRLPFDPATALDHPATAARATQLHALVKNAKR